MLDRVAGDCRRTCRECGRVFHLGQGAIDFYGSRDLELPKRCGPCRQARREAADRGAVDATADVLGRQTRRR